jgi:hypothetical protein
MVKPLSDAFVWDSFYLTHAGLKEEGVGVHNADSSTPANELSMKGWIVRSIYSRDGLGFVHEVVFISIRIVIADRCLASACSSVSGWSN